MMQKQVTRQDYQVVNEEAAKAARWMRDAMVRNAGTLSQEDAWKGVHEHFGSTCALSNETDSWLSRPVLTAFRKITPETIWDPVCKHWRLSRRGEMRVEGSRMLKP